MKIMMGFNSQVDINDAGSQTLHRHYHDRNLKLQMILEKALLKNIR